MRFSEFKIILKEDISPEELAGMKAVIAKKIKMLPPSDGTAKALKEIEDLLSNVNAGGKVGIINNELTKIDDPTVSAAQKLLARYILSMDVSPEDRNEMFKLWREDKLVKRDVLLGKGKRDFSEVINGYKTNPAIKELVDDIMRISELGQGKGEFGLSVLSKAINKQVGKGDLSIDGRPIEVKTTDGGAGRFTDQEVGAGPGFEQAARDINALVKSNGFEIPKSGLSLQGAITFALHMQAENPKVAKDFINKLENLIKIIFGGENSERFSASEAAKEITDAIQVGDVNQALQAYAQASFNFYMSKKKDEGVLYIAIKPNNIYSVFFKDAKELLDSGMRLHSGTIYLTSIADKRLPYPQIEIVDTKAGGGNPGEDILKAAPTKKTAVKQPAVSTTPTSAQPKQLPKAEVTNPVVDQFAANQGISDPKLIAAMNTQYKSLKSKRVSDLEIVRRLEKMFLQPAPDQQQSQV